jgi:hypothetical protein
LSLFPTTFAAEVVPPYVIIRVETLPPKPWPFTVSGLPLWLTTDKCAECFDRDRTGKAGKALEYINLQCKNEFSEDILREAAQYFELHGSKFWTSCGVQDSGELRYLITPI